MGTALALFDVALRLWRGTPVGSLDITFYRDDLTRLAHAPIVKHSEAMPDIDGALVGGASLEAEEFARIVQYRL